MEQQFEKQAWAAFIAEKRKAAGLTQQDLAERLYVSNSAVSKWERGLSYPDISLVAQLCKELKISEHEFFLASDDFSARQQEKQAKGFRRIKKGIALSLPVSYGIAIVTCFICNLAVERTLSWFWIVLAGIALAASITTLPKLLKNNKVVISSAVATALTYLLVWICALYSGGDWAGVAFLIATVPIVLCWVGIFICRYTSWNGWFKASSVSVLLYVTTTVMNPYVDFVLQEETRRTFADYFSPYIWNLEVLPSKLTAYCFLLAALIFLLKGVSKMKNS